MNIFFLSLDPAEAAKLHGDKHVIKMILESTQMLMTCHACLQPDRDAWAIAFQRDTGRSPYKPTHANHPCTAWVRASPANYAWLCRLALALCDEKMRRWPANAEHACRPLLEWLAAHPPPYPPGGSPEDLTPPARAMPDEYKVSPQKDPFEAAVASYLAYYEHKKRLGIVTFKKTQKEH